MKYLNQQTWGLITLCFMFVFSLVYFHFHLLPGRFVTVHQRRRQMSMMCPSIWSSVLFCLPTHFGERVGHSRSCCQVYLICSMYFVTRSRARYQLITRVTNLEWTQDSTRRKVDKALAPGFYYAMQYTAASPTNTIPTQVYF